MGVEIVDPASPDGNSDTANADGRTTIPFGAMIPAARPGSDVEARKVNGNMSPMEAPGLESAHHASSGYPCGNALSSLFTPWPIFYCHLCAPDWQGRP